MHLSDSGILELMRKDKIAGIQHLFERYYRPLVLYADEYVKDRYVAEDLVQELFVKLWMDDYLLKITDSTLAVYLYSAVRNRCYSYYRTKDVLRDTKALEDVDVPVEWVAGIDEDRMDRVMKEVELLPLRMRQVVECVMLKGLKYKEAAEELNISVNTVKFALKEGTKRLRERLAALGPNIFFFFFRH